jgi:hypothetical protein
VLSAMYCIRVIRGTKFWRNSLFLPTMGLQFFLFSVKLVKLLALIPICPSQ